MALVATPARQSSSRLVCALPLPLPYPQTPGARCGEGAGAEGGGSRKEGERPRQTDPLRSCCRPATSAARRLFLGLDRERQTHFGRARSGKEAAGSSFASDTGPSAREGSRKKKKSERTRAVSARRRRCGTPKATRRGGGPSVPAPLLLPPRRDHVRRARYGRPPTCNALLTSALGDPPPERE